MNDSNTITNKYVLEREQSKFICNIAYLSLFLSIYGIYCQQYLLSCGPGGVFITSIYYWSEPTFNTPRRYIDICYLSLSLMYHLYRGYYSQYMKIYYVIMFCSVSFYPLGYYYYNRKLYWESTYAHSMIHITANIGNIVLYSGKFMPSSPPLSGDDIDNHEF
jgi:hypothetical protein